MLLWTLVGYAGMLFLLSAFILNATQKIKSSSQLYAWLNIIASLLLLAYSVSLRSIPFAIVNTVWVIFSVFDLVKKQK